MIGQRLIIDSELLVLLIVGAASPTFIRKHKNLSTYTEDDFDFLAAFLARAPAVVLMPHTLTEASNLVRQIKDPMRTSIGEAFRALVDALGETYIESRRGIARAEFTKIGLTDSVLLELTQPSDVLLTSDHRLVEFATAAGHEVVNFRYLPRS
jgi:hypothetical protein